MILLGYKSLFLTMDSLRLSLPKRHVPTVVLESRTFQDMFFGIAKSLRLPLDWKDSAIWLDFEGSFRNTTVWINGHIVSIMFVAIRRFGFDSTLLIRFSLIPQT